MYENTTTDSPRMSCSSMVKASHAGDVINITSFSYSLPLIDLNIYRSSLFPWAKRQIYHVEIHSCIILFCFVLFCSGLTPFIVLGSKNIFSLLNAIQECIFLPLGVLKSKMMAVRFISVHFKGIEPKR